MPGNDHNTAQHEYYKRAISRVMGKPDPGDDVTPDMRNAACELGAALFVNIERMADALETIANAHTPRSAISTVTRQS